ncbi:MAG TPA: ribonuclease III [Candidatus Lustribacter sp.]|nr:ribonuclease III [Candidatus Lustribacter sp.]
MTRLPAVPSGPRLPAAALHGDLTEVLGAPLDEQLLTRALTHRSYAYEHGGLPNNERLEFLGDAVLGLVVTETLYAIHPDLPEGQLAKLRAAVVNMRALAEVSRTVGLGEHLLLGRGEESTGGRNKDSILADTLEAVIGTVFLCAGMPGARTFVHHLFDPLIATSAVRGAGLDWKTSLQEITSAGGFGAPDYKLEESGPDHEKSFTAVVHIDGGALGEGEGRTKKEAEQHAAEQAWTALDERRSAHCPPPSADSADGPVGADA